MIDIIHRWAVTESIHPHSIARLLTALGVGFNTIQNAAVPQGASEAAVSQRVALAAIEAGIHTWRNNVGAMMDDHGNMVRFGLCNDTAALNKKIKSADRIGVNPEIITPAMVGLPRGQFWSREVKKQGWVYTGTEHEVAQLKWAQLITSLGGDAAFTTGAI